MNEMILYVFHAFAGYMYRGKHVNDDAEDGYIVGLSWPEACIMTVATCLTEGKTWSGHFDKLNMYSYSRNSKLAMEQLVGNKRVFVEYQAEGEPVARPNGKDSER